MTLSDFFNSVKTTVNQIFPHKTEFYKMLEQERHKIYSSQGRKSHSEYVILDALNEILTPVGKDLPDDQTMMDRLKNVIKIWEQRLASYNDRVIVEDDDGRRIVLETGRDQRPKSRSEANAVCDLQAYLKKAGTMVKLNYVPSQDEARLAL